MSNVIRVHENGFQIHPLALHQHPDLNAFADKAEALLPFAYFLCKGAHKAAGHHRLQVQTHVLQQQSDLLYTCSSHTPLGTYFLSCCWYQQGTVSVVTS